MSRKITINPWDRFWSVIIVTELEPIKKYRRFLTRCTACGKENEQYMNTLLNGKWYWCRCWWTDKCKVCGVQIGGLSRKKLCKEHYSREYSWAEDRKIKSLPKVPLSFELLSEEEKICIYNKYLGKTFKEIWEIFSPKITRQAVESKIKRAEERYFKTLKK